MQTFLASPQSHIQANAALDMPVLVSFALVRSWFPQVQQAWGPVLADSGAFSELNSGQAVSIEAYRDWLDEWGHRFVAAAGLDDIGGNFARSWSNYLAAPGTFPTIHDTDPDGALGDLVGLARERGGWIGVGVLPRNSSRLHARAWVHRVLEEIPDDLHVHGWALRAFRDLLWERECRTGTPCSVDSTNWWRDAMNLRVVPLCRHLTYGECLEIVVKRYQREQWVRPVAAPEQGRLF